jgi:charged multivesicular body protein 7
MAIFGSNLVYRRADQVKENLRLKRKDIALSYLRSKKQLEELLPKRLRSLETIQTTLDQVESARHDIEVYSSHLHLYQSNRYPQIMKAYETSTSTLRTILSDPALQRDRVDATLDAMAEANAEYKEIEETIEAGMPDTGEVVDEDELAKELEALVQEREREEKEEKERKERQEREAKERRERELIEGEQRENEIRARELERDRQRLAARESKPASEARAAEEASEELWRKRWEEANQEKEVQRIKDRQKELEKRAQWELVE